MNASRRSLRFESFEEVMTDVERLLQGHETVGKWSLAQICRHLAVVLRRHVDLPAATVFDPADLADEDEKQRMLRDGVLPSGIVAPAGAVPDVTRTEREEAEGLREAIEYYTSSPGPVCSHRIFGPLTRAEWDRFELVHLAHHLSFVLPR